MGALLLAAGAKGKRFALPHARIMIHQPLGGVQGQATDIDIQAREILRMREELNRILVHHTGQPMEKIQKDTDRDFFMTAEQAKEYGIVDEVISSKPTTRPVAEAVVDGEVGDPGRWRGRAKAAAHSSARSAARARTTSASSSPGPTVYICDECIELCNDIIAEEWEEEKSRELRSLPKPAEIKNVLDQYVVGQERAKKVLAVAVHNHYKRIEAGAEAGDVELQKSNILLIGPTGSGKTLLAQTLAKILNVPVHHRRRHHASPRPATSARTWRTSSCACCRPPTTTSSAPSAASSTSTRSTRSPASARTPPSPATSRARACSRRCSRSSRARWPTCRRRAGASTRSRSSSRSTPPTSSSSAAAPSSGSTRSSSGAWAQTGMGFGAEIKSREDRRVGDLLALVQPEDLLKYGLIPEFVGRLPVVATLHELDEAALVRILREPKNAIIKQYQKFFELEKVRLKFTDDAVAAIAREAMKRGTGARGLRAVLEEVMLDVMYELPSHARAEGVHHHPRGHRQQGAPHPHLRAEGAVRVARFTLSPVGRGRVRGSPMTSLRAALCFVLLFPLGPAAAQPVALDDYLQMRRSLDVPPATGAARAGSSGRRPRPSTRCWPRPAGARAS